MKLGILKVGVDIAAIAETSHLPKQQYPEVFNGADKINTKHVNPVMELSRQSEIQGGACSRNTEHRCSSDTFNCEMAKTDHQNTNTKPNSMFDLWQSMRRREQ